MNWLCISRETETDLWTCGCENLSLILNINQYWHSAQSYYINRVNRDVAWNANKETPTKKKVILKASEYPQEAQNPQAAYQVDDIIRTKLAKRLVWKFIWHLFRQSDDASYQPFKSDRFVLSNISEPQSPSQTSYSTSVTLWMKRHSMQFYREAFLREYFSSLKGEQKRVQGQL